MVWGENIEQKKIREGFVFALWERLGVPGIGAKQGMKRNSRSSSYSDKLSTQWLVGTWQIFWSLFA